MATKLDQLVYSPNCYMQIFRLNFYPQSGSNPQPLEVKSPLLSGDPDHDGGASRPTQAEPASPLLLTFNNEITKAASDHKRRQWREFVESIDHRTDSTKLWRTIKGIDGKSKQTEENEGITFIGKLHIPPKLIANSINRQFTTSKLGKHSSSRRTSSDVEGFKADVSRGIEIEDA